MPLAADPSGSAWGAAFSWHEIRRRRLAPEPANPEPERPAMRGSVSSVPRLGHHCLMGQRPRERSTEPERESTESVALPAGRVWELGPSPSLRSYVRCYHYTELRLGAARVSKPLTARPEQMMQFSLARPFSVLDHAAGTTSEAPSVVVVGRQTRRNLDLISTGDLGPSPCTSRPPASTGSSICRWLM
jgi:hypothetical protein